MRILVTSDSHRDYFSLKKAVLSQPSAEIIINLGDSEGDIETLKLDFPEKHIVAVKGNCDYLSELKETEIFIIEGKKILATHGHKYYVKNSLIEIMEAGRKNNVDIILYGHTHIAFTNYSDGIYVMNPGSIKGYKSSYGIIDITKVGIVTNIVEVK